MEPLSPLTSFLEKSTRVTAFNAIAALKKRLRLPAFATGGAAGAVPFAFVSAAEAGWPEVALGDKIEAIVPDALRRYLTAKRAVEAELEESAAADPSVFRPIVSAHRPTDRSTDRHRCGDLLLFSPLCFRQYSIGWLVGRLVDIEKGDIGFCHLFSSDGAAHVV